MYWFPILEIWTWSLNVYGDFLIKRNAINIYHVTLFTRRPSPFALYKHNDGHDDNDDNKPGYGSPDIDAQIAALWPIAVTVREVPAWIKTVTDQIAVYATPVWTFRLEGSACPWKQYCWLSIDRPNTYTIYLHFNVFFSFFKDTMTNDIQYDLYLNNLHYQIVYHGDTGSRNSKQLSGIIGILMN